MAITKYGFGTPVTSFGPPPNATTITKYGTGQTTASTSGAIGSGESLTLIGGFGTAIPASQTGLVTSRVKMNSAGRILACSHGNVSITGTDSFDIYNETTSTIMVAAQSLSTGAAATTTTIASPSYASGDVIALRVTTAGASTVTGLEVRLAIEHTGVAGGQLSYT